MTRRAILLAILATLPSAATAQTVTMQQVANAAFAAVPSSTLGKPSGPAVLDGNGRITVPVVGDVSSAPATAASSLVTGTSARTAAERAMSDPQPADFILAGQSVADLVTQKIELGAVLNAALAAGARHIRIPCGEYTISTTVALTGTQQIEGAGRCVQLFVASPTADIFVVTGSYNSVGNFSITTAVTRTAGAVFRLSDAFHTVVDHVIVDRTSASVSWYWGLVVAGANDSHISDVEMRPGGTQSAIVLTGTDQRAEDTYLSLMNINGWQNDVELQWSSGAYLSNMDLLGATGYGVLFDPGAGQEVDGTRATQVLSDSNTQDGWHFGGTGGITETSLVNCWGATNGMSPGTSTIVANATGLNVTNPNTNNLSVTASEFHSNTAQGIYVGAGKNIVINGNSLFANGLAGATSLTSGGTMYDGIMIDVGASYVTANGNMGGVGGINAGTPSHQRYLINNVSTGYVTMIGNMGNSDYGGAPVYSSVTTGVVSANNNGN